MSLSVGIYQEETTIISQMDIIFIPKLPLLRIVLKNSA